MSVLSAMVDSISAVGGYSSTTTSASPAVWPLGWGRAQQDRALALEASPFPALSCCFPCSSGGSRMRQGASSAPSQVVGLDELRDGAVASGVEEAIGGDDPDCEREGGDGGRLQQALVRTRFQSCRHGPVLREK